MSKSKPLVINEIGTINAIISGIRTLRDGSFEVKFEVNPDDQKVISKLMNLYAINERLLTLAMVNNGNS